MNDITYKKFKKGLLQLNNYMKKNTIGEDNIIEKIIQKKSKQLVQKFNGRETNLKKKIKI